MLTSRKIKYANLWKKIQGMKNLLFDDSGKGEASKIPGKIECDDDYRSEFLQNYLEVLYQSIQ